MSSKMHLSIDANPFHQESADSALCKGRSARDKRAETMETCGGVEVTLHGTRGR